MNKYEFKVVTKDEFIAWLLSQQDAVFSAVVNAMDELTASGMPADIAGNLIYNAAELYRHELRQNPGTTH